MNEQPMSLLGVIVTFAITLIPLACVMAIFALMIDASAQRDEELWQCLRKADTVVDARLCK